MLPIFLTAIALVLVIEGILPFLAPQAWKRMMFQLASQSDRAIRIIGLISLLLGALLMYLVHSEIIFR